IADRGRRRRAGVRYCMDIIDLAFIRCRHGAGGTQQQSSRRASAADVPVDGVVSPPRGTWSPTTGGGPRRPGYRRLNGGAGGVQRRWRGGGAGGALDVGSLGRGAPPTSARSTARATTRRPIPPKPFASVRERGNGRCHKVWRPAEATGPPARGPDEPGGRRPQGPRAPGRRRQQGGRPRDPVPPALSSAGRSALVALEALDGAVDSGVADGRVVEGDLAVLGRDALEGGGLLRLAVVVELHHRELAGRDLDQRELVVLHGEHGVADGAGLAVAAHDLRGEG